MSENPYLQQAITAAGTLTSQWFTAQTPSDWVPDDYWQTPTIASELVTHMTLAGTQDHLDICQAAQEAGRPWLTTCAYLDDLSVWGRFHVAAAAWLLAVDLPAAGPFRADAQTVHDNLASQWTDDCGGGLFWMRSGDGNFKASNSTLGLAEIALRIGDPGLPAPADLQLAQKVWRWITSAGFVDSSGGVWGGLLPTCGVNPDNPPVVALQGNALGPLWRLSYASGDTTLLETAMQIFAGTASRFCWPGTSILTNGALDQEWATASEDFRAQKLGAVPFKGICIGFLGECAAYLATVENGTFMTQASRVADLVRANADALIANFPQGAYGMDWHTPSPSNEPDASPKVNACLQYNALATFDAAARVAGVPSAAEAIA